MLTWVTPRLQAGRISFLLLVRLLAVPWVKVLRITPFFHLLLLTCMVFSVFRRRNAQSEASFYLPSAVAVFMVSTFVLFGVSESAFAQRGFGKVQKRSSQKRVVEETPRTLEDPVPGGPRAPQPPPPFTPGGGGGGDNPFIPIYIPIIQPPPPTSGDPNYIPPGIGGGGNGDNPRPPVVNPPLPSPDPPPIEPPPTEAVEKCVSPCSCHWIVNETGMDVFCENSLRYGKVYEIVHFLVEIR